MNASVVRDPPSALGPFRLLRRLGQGGFAPVWLAEEVYGGKKVREVALKLFVLPERFAQAPADAERWLFGVVDEARALCRVEHPNVVRFYALHQNQAQGIVGLAMEYVAGPNLETLVSERGCLEEVEILEAGISVAWALAAVHQAGLLHRDVKPANIVRTNSGYKLIDFGIVVDTRIETGEASRQTPPPLIGTPGYVAPECIWLAAHPTSASDLYALGVTLHRLAAGSLPSPPGRFPALSFASPSLSAASLADIVALLLSPDVGKRPRHADWVARELERIRDLSRRASEPPRAATSSDRPPASSKALASTVGTSSPRALLPVDAGTRRGGDRSRAPWSEPPLIGRGVAVDLLLQSAREAKQGAMQMVLLTGPLGIGRTRLLNAAIEVAGFAPDRVLCLRCSPERKSPLKPLLRALEALPDGGDGAFALIKDAIDRALAPNLLPGAKQSNEALEGVEDAIVEAAREVPILISVDDLQWGDAYTLGLVQLLIERVSHPVSARLFVVATTRDEPNPSAPLRALVGDVRGKMRPGVKHVAVGPLTPDQTTALGRAICPMDPEVDQALLRGSGGVPFFVVHALLAWRETGAIQWDVARGVWRAMGHPLLQEDVPGVASLVEARLASYFEPNSAEWRAAFRALAVIAVYGGGLYIETLFRVVGGDEASVEAALEVLVDAGIITVAIERQEYGFGQEMVRQAVLNMVRSKPWFHRLHRALLDAVAETPSTADAAFLANGYEKLGLRYQARSWLDRAMKMAVRTGLFVEAADFGDRLAGLAESPEERVDVEFDVVHALVLGRTLDGVKERLIRIEALSKAQATAGRRARVQDVKRRIYRLEAARWLHEPAEDAALIADADELSEPELSCKARLAIAGVTRGPQALSLAADAIVLAEGLDPALEFVARVLRVELNYASSARDLDLAERDLQRALSIARAMSSRWQEILVEGDLAVLEAEIGRVGDAIERQKRLVEQAHSLGMRAQHRLLSHNLSTCLMRAGRAAEAERAASRTAKLALEAGDPMLRGVALSLRAHALRATGDLEGALACVMEAERLQRERNDHMRAQTLLRRAEILDALGRVDEAYEDVRTARSVAEEHGERGFVVTALLWEKLHLAQRGLVTREELAQAIQETEQAGVGQRALARSLIERASVWLGWRTAAV